MPDTIISSVLQVLVFTLIPFIVFLISNKTARGFLSYIGLKRSNAKANMMGLLVALLIGLPFLLLSMYNPEFKGILTNTESVTGKIRAMGWTPVTILTILFTAIIKTSLSEEILFRGFIAKRLIALLGFQAGNMVQAAIFGIIHSLLFLSITDNMLFIFMIFLIPGVAAYFKVYINEKMADGSIIPGWIAHGAGNLIAYTSIALMA